MYIKYNNCSITKLGFPDMSIVLCLTSCPNKLAGMVMP